MKNKKIILKQKNECVPITLNFIGQLQESDLFP